jgi:uroporphyrinogen-III synthase
MTLSGKRVALLEGRMSGEMAGLVRRHGGEPYAVPAVREHALSSGAAVAALLDELHAGRIQNAVFLTGAGARALFHEAEELGRLPELLADLRAVRTICRGPKPSAALSRERVPISLAASEPYTTAELLHVLASVELSGAGVALIHYGERDQTLFEYLRGRGAHLIELCLYEWLLPEDPLPLQGLVREIIDGRVDAITFTSQVQARHLFQVAAVLGNQAELAAALNGKTIVASLAPTCANALRELGVEPHVIPVHSKMGQLIVALEQHIEASAVRA